MSQCTTTIQARLGTRADALMRTGQDDALDAAVEHALTTFGRNLAVVHHR